MWLTVKLALPLSMRAEEIRQRLQALIHPSRRHRDPTRQGTCRSVGKILIIQVGGWSCRSLPSLLWAAGYDSEVVQGREAALNALQRETPALLVVGGAADPEFYSALRRASAAPILALAPAADQEEAVAAFAAGVDDYQASSISHGETLARVNALVRRASAAT